MLALAIIATIAPVVFGLFNMSIIYDLRSKKDGSKILLILLTICTVVTIATIWLFYVRMS